MKTPFIIFLSFFFGVNIYGQLKEVDLSQEVQRVLNVKNSQDKEEIYQALRKLDNQVIYSWGQRDSRAEAQLKQSIQSQLEPIKDQLIQYAGTEDHGLRGRSASLLGYTQSNSQVIEILYKIALDTRFDKTQTDVVTTAIRSIYKLNAANEKIEDAILVRLSQGLTNSSGQYRIFSSIAGSKKIDKAIPFLIAGLEGNEFDIIDSAEALKLMGSQAKEALPELQKQLAKAKAEGARFQVIEALEFAINSVSGNPPFRNQIQTNSSNVMVTNQQISAIQLLTNQTTQENVVPEEPEKNSHWPKWLPVIIGLGLVISLLVKGSNRKKKEADLMDKNNQSQ